MEYVTRDRLYLFKNGKRVVVEAGKKVNLDDLTAENVANMMATGQLMPVEEVAAAPKKKGKK